MPIRFPRTKNGSSLPGVDKGLLRRVMVSVNKSYKKKKRSLEVTTLDNSVFAKPRYYVSSGILPVDCVVSYGMGFPSGITELFGGEASGKTALLENTLADAQKKGYYTVLFPQEFAVDYRRVKILHLKTDELIIGDAETIEDVYSQIKMIVKGIRKKDSKTPIVIGWDSVAATPTRSEMEAKGGLEASDMGKAAQQMSKLFRRLVRFLFVNRVCLLCVNQLRSSLSMYGPKESTFGGRALRFYAWVRIRLGSTKVIIDNGEEVGFMCSLLVVKNKIAPPRQACKFPIYWDKGIDKAMAIWEYAVEKQVFTRKGTTYRFDGNIITKKSFRKIYKNNTEGIDALLRQSVNHE